MGIREFIVALAAALAWPVVVIIAAFLFRGPLRQLIPMLQALKFKDFEMSFFSQELKRIEAEAGSSIAIEPPPHDETTGDPREPLQILSEAERLSREFPEPAVAHAWLAVEGALLGAAKRAGLASANAHRQNPRALATALAQAGILPGNILDAIDRMRRLRNSVSHTREGIGEIAVSTIQARDLPVSTTQAREYIAVARGIIDLLQRKN